MQLSLIISTSGQAGILPRIFKALQRQSLPPSEILVAEDGMDEESVRIIDLQRKSLGIPLRHLRQEKNGFRKSRILNRAISRASGDYIVFIDGDCLPARDFIKDHAALAERGFWVQGRRAFVKEPHTGTFEPSACTALTFALRGRLSGASKALRLPFPLIRRNRDMYGILGCNLGIWKEDSDLGARLYHLGRSRKIVRGRAILFHLNHPPASRHKVEDNEALLRETLESKRVRARYGLANPLPTHNDPSSDNLY